VAGQTGLLFLFLAEKKAETLTRGVKKEGKKEGSGDGKRKGASEVAGTKKKNQIGNVKFCLASGAGPRGVSELAFLDEKRKE